MSDKAIVPKHEAALEAVIKAGELDREAVRRAVVAMLIEDRRAAYSTRQPAVAVSASTCIARICGLIDNPPAASAGFVVQINGADAGLL